MGRQSGGKVAMMGFSWQWPAAALAGALAAAAVVVLIVAFSRRRGVADPVFSLDDDLATEHAARLLRRWRRGSRLAVALLAVAIGLSAALLARPSHIDQGEERASRRDIVLCLDVSGSTLPYDREVIETYLQLVDSFQGERIGLSIFNSTSRTVFPLTDDYDLVAGELKAAAETLRGVETQDDIDQMSDEQYQRIADWLEGTQNRTDATSLIGDGVVSCAAMLPGFAYGTPDEGTAARHRAASIVLATDNVVSGTPTYTLAEALDLTAQAGISVDGLFSGPRSSEGEATTTDMKDLIETHGGMFLTQSDSSNVTELVRQIDRRRIAVSEASSGAAPLDAPGWFTLALAAAVAAWLGVAWRLKR